MSDALDVLSFESTTILGGDGGAGGNAGNVNVSNSGSIFTSGAFASGIVTQSIGGGGGMGGNVLTFEFSLDDIIQPTDSYLDELNNLTSFEMNAVGAGGAGGNGGDVNVINSGNIVTSGAFAHGVFAQSVGGGGGLAGISEELDISTLIFGNDTQGQTADINGSGAYFAGSLGGNGSGGKVTVNQTGNIITYGNGSNGIFAQSAGGLLSGGEVDITVDGNIITDGNDSVGIFVQSIGGTGGSDISVNIVSGIIQGGARHGAGVQIDGGADNTLTNRGNIFALSGTAILGGSGNDTIENFGSVTGSVNLGAGNNAFNNNSGAVFNAGPVVNLGAGNLLTNGGTLSPGGADAVANTTITGDLRQTESGTYFVDIDLASYESDRLNVSGTSEIAGLAGINLLNAGWCKPGTWQTTILSSSDGVAGLGFNIDYNPSVVIKYRLLNPNSTDVVLESNIDFCPVNLNHNQRVIGDAVNKIQLNGSSEKFAPFAAELLNLPDTRTLADAYDHLSPESFDASTTTTFEVTQVYTQILVKRMHSIRSYLDVTGKASGTGQTLPYGVWTDGFGKWADQDADSEFTGFKYSLGGAGVGIDYLVEDGVLAGISYGQAHTLIDLDNDRGRGDIESYFGSIYGSLFDEHSYLDMALSYGRQSFDNSRRVEVGELTEVAKSSHNGDLFSAYAEAGCNIEMQKWLLQPFAALQYIYLDEESFNESGAEGVNLLVDDRKTGSLVSDLGMRFTRPFEKYSWFYVPDVTVAWRHDFDIDDRSVTAAFDGSPGVAFTTQSRDIDKDGVIIGGGMTLLNKAGVSLYFRYDSEIRSDYAAQQLSGGLRYEF
jgi:outer membrane autotransporter protein